MNQQRVVMIELSRLRAHPSNSNVMKEALLEKLVEHIGASGQYPPVIVREVGEEVRPSSKDRMAGMGQRVYQVLDGHHRWKALEQLGHTRAACVVWEADDAQALVLLATLNRLQGQDDPGKRAALLTKLHEQFGKTASELGRWLPDAREDLKKLLSLGKQVALPRLAKVDDAGLPSSVVFFLSGEQKRRLEEVLKKLGGTREQGVMAMVERMEAMWCGT